jgi:hypothetical protein
MSALDDGNSIVYDANQQIFFPLIFGSGLTTCRTKPHLRRFSVSTTLVQLEGHQPQLFKSQTERTIALLLNRRGEWVPSPEVAKVAGLQYAARIFSARRMGYTILNRTRRVGDQVHGEYMLTACPGETPSLFQEAL